MSVEVLHADSRDVLSMLPSNSIDSVVTDPPYALVSITKRFGAENAAPARVPEGGSGAYARASRGFMGKTWDTGEAAFAVTFWREVYRVLKPGGHVLAFAGTRTYHRLVCAIEDAGFEIRDQIGWAYGSGFPKSHDVAKGIEKRRVEDLEPTRSICRAIRAAMDAKGLRSHQLVQYFGDCHPRLIDHWAARDTDSQPSLPTWEQWCMLRDVLDMGGDLDREVRRLNDRKGEFGASWHAREVTGEHVEWSDRSNYALTSRDGLRRDEAATEEARRWQGWGTALKPAWEPICVARKPLIGTVAENVLQHGTGALNIDGCRVWTEDTTGRTRNTALGRLNDDGWQPQRQESEGSPAGRWPANLCHDGSEEVVAAFPETTSGAFNGNRNADKFRNTYGTFQGPPEREKPFEGSTGSAARFFYSAKASKADRAGSKHPTVKPVALMRWLCRLVTPPGGIVLDPFAGSGTTGQAAREEGFDAILIEREDEYIADIHRRLEPSVPAADRTTTTENCFS